ncbi:MAG: DNA repair protein RecN [Polyangiaceae bacterium]|nr:DNA repair protein RecN [Polyangiaceae bacterium]
MLLRISIQNFVLIESLDLELEHGFSVLTGETGAGKSILVDALSLVLGARAQPEVVRSGAKFAEVEALFDLKAYATLAGELRERGFLAEEDTELVLRRTVGEGKSRAFINGRLATVTELSGIARSLCDIASQHESVALTDPAVHLAFLDAFGKLDAKREELGRYVDDLHNVRKELETLSALEKIAREKEDLLLFERRELDELDPVEGEEVDLRNERGRLRHAEKLMEVAQRASLRLYEGENSLCDELGRISSDLEGLEAIDGSLGRLALAVENARAELTDTGRALSRYAETIEANPGRLDEVEDRLSRIEKSLRRHGPTTKELVAFRAQIEADLAKLANSGQEREALLGKSAELVRLVGSLAKSLSRKRRDSAERLADAIGKELAQLGMGRARVVVDVSSQPTTGLSLDLEGLRLSRSGIDRVEFLIAPNPGEDPKPLRKIASGGELSRALLAIKKVLAENAPAGLYVFDEVDSGVGGAIAEVIGHSIGDVAKHRQVLCITHLPQIAALAEHHYLVEKHETAGRTQTSVRKLSKSERIDELARMLGGVRVGEASKRAAKEMLATRA